ncbi:MAG TPA: HAMP domain-containing sensor histidine kinase [bacterium]|nr:HAMP domain-containing sensor histidine kinase [bacterium]
MFEPAWVSAALFTVLTVYIALAWRIVISGKRTPDGIFAGLSLLSLGLLFSVASASYFPFFSILFFAALLALQTLFTLYIYTFPNALVPPLRWNILFAAADLLFLSFFSADPRFAAPATAFSTLFFFAAALFFIARKQRYLRPEMRRSANITVGLAALPPLLIGISATVGLQLLIITPFLVAVPVVLAIVGALLFLSRRISRDIPLTAPLVLLVIIFTLPLGFVWLELFPLRVLISNNLPTRSFLIPATFGAFLTINLFAAAALWLADRFYRYASLNQAYYERVVASFRARAASATTHQELLRLFDSTLRHSFRGIADARYILFSDEDERLTELGDLRSFDPTLEESLIVEWFSDGEEDHLLRHAAPSGLLEEECARIGADLLIPLREKGLLFGVLAIRGKGLSAAAARGIAALTAVAADNYLRLSLFSLILRKERQLREAEYFTETGNMVSVIAHEIRTPLTSAMFNLDVLNDSLRAGTAFDPEYLDIAHRELKRLNDTVEKMLLFGRNIKLEPADGSLEEFVADLQRTYLAAAVPIRFEPPIPKRCRLDWDRLRYLAINLINNALQAIEQSGNPGEVTVTIREKGTALILEVTDTGPGIPEEACDHIFDPFFTTKKEGNGLGLAICRKIARLMEGTIELSSSRPGQTRFTLTVPIER